MADRVKYFMLGLLFLVVAGVIAYDRAYDSWNSDGERKESARGDSNANRGEAFVGPKPDPLIVKRTPPSVEVLPPEPRPLENAAPPPPAPPTPLPEVKPAPPPVTPTPQPEPPVRRAPDRFHVVRSGETLEAIAMQYYQSRDGIAWIVDANKIRDPNRILANTRLVIPARTATETSKTPAVVTTPKIPARHVVRSGDGDLYAICRRYYGAGGEGARVAEIMSLNNLFSADVAVGSEIRLPPK